MFPGLRLLADEEGHACVPEQGYEPGDAGLLPRSLAAARRRD
jgi:hypothetical protein